MVTHIIESNKDTHKYTCFLQNSDRRSWTTAMRLCRWRSESRSNDMSFPLRRILCCVFGGALDFGISGTGLKACLYTCQPSQWMFSIHNPIKVSLCFPLQHDHSVSNSCDLGFCASSLCHSGRNCASSLCHSGQKLCFLLVSCWTEIVLPHCVMPDRNCASSLCHAGQKFL
jgi:hypothetical protein